MNKKKIYIAGAISGLAPVDVLYKFEVAEQKVRAAGYEPYNPYLLLGCAPELEDASWETLMRLCISALMTCDAVVLCHDWQHSRGAVIERDIAMKVGIPVLLIENPIKLD